MTGEEEGWIHAPSKVDACLGRIFGIYNRLGGRNDGGEGRPNPDSLVNIQGRRATPPPREGDQPVAPTGGRGPDIQGWIHAPPKADFQHGARLWRIFDTCSRLGGRNDGWGFTLRQRRAVSTGHRDDGYARSSSRERERAPTPDSSRGIGMTVRQRGGYRGWDRFTPWAHALAHLRHLQPARGAE